MSDNQPPTVGARIDAGMPPVMPNAELEERRKRGETLEETAQRIAYEKQKAEAEHTEAVKKESKRLAKAPETSTSSPEEQDIAAGMAIFNDRQKEEQLEAARRRAERNSRPYRVKGRLEKLKERLRVPIKEELHTRMEFDRKGQPIKRLGAGAAAIKAVRTVGNVAIKSMANTAEDFLTERTSEPPTWSYDYDNNTATKTWKKGRRYLSPKYHTWVNDVISYSQTFKLVNGKAGTPITTPEIVSHTITPFDVEQKQQLKKDVIAALNGADLQKEIFGSRRESAVPATPGAQFGGRFGGVQLFGATGMIKRPRTVIRPNIKTNAMRDVSVPIRNGKLKKTSKADVAALIKAGTIKVVKVQAPLPAVTAQAITSPYGNEYAQVTSGYRSQVRRYLPTPNITSYRNWFVAPTHRSLGLDLYLGEKTFGLRTGLSPFQGPRSFGADTDTGRPYSLTRGSIFALAGISHEQGPSHDMVNQIFNPSYAVSRLRGTGRFTGSNDIWGLFVGGPRK